MSNFDIPCENCVCLPICRNKQIKPMFRQCEILFDFCHEFVDQFSNMDIGREMLKLSGVLNEVLNRHLIPSLQTTDDRDQFTIGFVDIHPDMFEDRNLKVVQDTHRIFNLNWHVNILDQAGTRKYLQELLDKDE